MADPKREALVLEVLNDTSHDLTTDAGKKTAATAIVDKLDGTDGGGEATAEEARAAAQLVAREDFVTWCRKMGVQSPQAYARSYTRRYPKATWRPA